jgi:hypothetical protein
MSLRDIFYNDLKLSSDKWDPYFDVYETYFAKFIGKAPTLVEVGVQGGGSIEMWRKYLGADAKIVGIDIDPNVLNHQPHYEGDTTVLVGDQASPEFWDNFLKDVPEIDIFIDDGGHSMEQQKVTFEKVFPHITPGGVFICEDTHSSYEAYHRSGLYHENSFIEYAKKLVDVIHYEHIQNNEKYKIPDSSKYLCEGLTGVAFYDSMIVFIKDGPKEFKRVFANPKN